MQKEEEKTLKLRLLFLWLTFLEQTEIAVQDLTS